MSVRVAPSTMNSGRLQNSCQVHTDKKKNMQISADFTKNTSAVFLMLTVLTSVKGLIRRNDTMVVHTQVSTSQNAFENQCQLEAL